MRVLTVCPTVERFDLIRAFEKSYSDTAPPEEPAVFVAMGSDDGTVGFLSDRASDGRPYLILRPDTVLPFGKAVNAGVKLGLERFPESDVVVISNDDIVLQPGWPAAVAEAIEGGMDIVGAKLVYPLKREQPPTDPHPIQHFGKWYTLDLFPFHILRGQPETHEKAQGIIFVPDVTFALVAIRRELWEVIGGLDEGYQSGFEDDDFCLQARERGALIGVHSGFYAIHRESATTGQDSEQKQREWERFSERWIDSGRIQWPLGLLMGWRS